VKINEIGAPDGANRDTKRRGRGSGSGHGKTSCRGRKGAKKRSGRTTRPGFEGGQMPLIRRIPKRGFNYPFKNLRQAVNVGSLNRFRENSVVGPEEMKRTGLIGSASERVKILGDGDLTKSLTIKAHALSENAKKKIEKSGSRFEPLSGEFKIHPEEETAKPKA
jgi:large subunit ribosomal protein L15